MMNFHVHCVERVIIMLETSFDFYDFILAEKWRVQLKGNVPDYIHATFIHVSGYYYMTVVIETLHHYDTCFIITMKSLHFWQ